MVSKNNIVLLVFLSMAVAYLVWLVFNVMKSNYCTGGVEHFTDISAGNYESRMTVIKVFDTVLHRKPKQEEIEKYYTIENEQDMLITILSDYGINQEEKENFVDPIIAAATPTPPVSASTPMPNTTPAMPTSTTPMPNTTPLVSTSTPAASPTIPPTPKMVNVPYDDLVSNVKVIKDALSKIEKMYA